MGMTAYFDVEYTDAETEKKGGSRELAVQALHDTTEAIHNHYSNPVSRSLGILNEDKMKPG